MKLILFLTLVLASKTYADPITFTGDKSSNGIMIILSYKNYKLVNTLTEAGKKKATELELNGYICEHEASTKSLCSKFLKNESISPELHMKLASQVSGLTFRFNDPLSSWSLINKAEINTEWTLRQQVQVFKDNIELAKSVDVFFLETPKLNRLYFTNSNSSEVFWFNVRNNNLYYVPPILRLPEKDGWSTFLVEYALK